MQHLTNHPPAKCVICGTPESEVGTYPMVVGVGRVCLTDGMKIVKCEACGSEIKLLTSSKLQGRTLCLSDYMRSIEKFRQHIVANFDEEKESVSAILARAHAESPEGYTLLAIRRGRNSTHVWEAEYEKTEVFQMRCS